jgi:hypothetical protein
MNESQQRHLKLNRKIIHLFLECATLVHVTVSRPDIMLHAYVHTGGSDIWVREQIASLLKNVSPLYGFDGRRHLHFASFAHRGRERSFNDFVCATT